VPDARIQQIENRTAVCRTTRARAAPISHQLCRRDFQLGHFRLICIPDSECVEAAVQFSFSPASRRLQHFPFRALRLERNNKLRNPANSDFVHSTECSADCIYIQLTGCRIFSKHVARLRKHASQPVLALPAAAWVRAERVVRLYSCGESFGIAVSPAFALLSQSDAMLRAFGNKRHQLCSCFVGVDICARDDY